MRTMPLPTRPTRTQPTPAQRVREAEAPQLQAVGGPRWQCAAGGDGVTPSLPTAQVRRRARAQQQTLCVGHPCIVKECTQLPEADVTLAVGPRTRLPIGLAQPVTLVIKSAQHGELEAEVRVCGRSDTRSPVLSKTSFPREPTPVPPPPPSPPSPTPSPSRQPSDLTGIGRKKQEDCSE